MAEVSLFRLHALRAVYALLAFGLGSDMWPLLFHHKPWDLMHGVAVSLLAAVSAMGLIGLRYPLKMLPLLFFEIAWKTIWLTMIALPLWQAGKVDAATAETIKACLMGVIFPIVIPWGYVVETYVRAPGDRWLPKRGVKVAA
jgi:hypothetical protein